MGCVFNATPRPLYPGEKTRYTLYRRLAWPQGRCGRVPKFSPSPGFDHRTFQPARNGLDGSCKENQNTSYVQQLFYFENHAANEIMYKIQYIVESERPPVFDPRTVASRCTD
jgi:hypothetical protein